MNHLRTILAALLFAAAPAAAQTIKTLGYNTTNGNVVAATNLTFTNSLNFTTNARAATRTNLGGTTVGNSVFTATNAAAAANAIGLGATNNVEFNNITIADQTLTLSHGPEDDVFVRNESGNLELQANVSVIALSPISFNNTTNAAITRTNLGGTTVGNAVFTATNAAAAATAIGLGTTNNVTFNTVTLLGNGDEVQLTGSHIDSLGYNTLFSFEEQRFSQGGSNVFDWDGDFGVYRPATFATNVTVNGNVTTSGTLTATGNVTMAGTGNTAPNQTAASGSSIMTRSLTDIRSALLFGLLDQARPNMGTLTSVNGASGTLSQNGFEITTGTNTNAASVWNPGSAGQFGRKQTSQGGNANTVWSGRIIVGWWFSRGLSSNSEARLQFGRAFNASTHAALTTRGVGVRIATNSVFFEAHDGTTHFETTNAVALGANNPQFMWAVVENGTANFYFGQTLVATVTNNVPTNNTAANDFGYVMSISNTSTNSSILRVFANPGFVMQQ